MRLWDLLRGRGKRPTNVMRVHPDGRREPFPVRWGGRDEIGNRLWIAEVGHLEPGYRVTFDEIPEHTAIRF